MKEKKTKRPVRHGERKWMTEEQARETSTKDLIRVTNKIFNKLIEGDDKDES